MDDWLGIAISVLIAVVVLVGIVAAFYFNREARDRRALRRARTVQIARFPEGGVAKIVGNLRVTGEPLTAPLSGRRCAFWEVVVYDRGGGNSDSSGWRKIIRESDGQDFLDDGSGVAIAHLVAAHAMVDTETDVRQRTGSFYDATPAQKEFLAAHGAESIGWFGRSRPLRSTEGVLSDGDLVAVKGQGRREPDAQSTVEGHGRSASRLEIEAPPGGRLLVSDDVSGRRWYRMVDPG